MTAKQTDKETEAFVKNLGEEPDKQTLTIDFEYVTPSEPYFHIARTLLAQYLDGKEQEVLDISSLTDHILERASIGSVIASSLGAEDPERNPKYKDLDDEAFEKVCLKANA